MRLLHPTESLFAPNTCVICDSTPSPATQRVLDTERNSIAPGPSDAVWRKYICEQCGLEIANKFGFVSNTQAKAAFHAAEVAVEKLDNVRAKVQAAAEDIVAFAKDVQLGNERAALGKWLEGEFVQVKDEVEKVAKQVGRPRKQAATGDVAGADGSTSGSEPSVSG